MNYKLPVYKSSQGQDITVYENRAGFISPSNPK